MRGLAEIEAGRGREPGCLTRAAIRVLHERLKPVLCRIASRPLLSHDHDRWPTKLSSSVGCRSRSNRSCRRWPRRRALPSPCCSGRAGRVETRREVERGWGAVTVLLQSIGCPDLGAEATRFMERMHPPQTEKEQIADQIGKRMIEPGSR
jgi:hypothetical protein